MVDPVVRGDHRIRIQSGDDVVDNLFLRESQLGRMHTIDLQPDRRIIQVLRNVDLADSWKLPDAGGKILRHVERLFQISCADLKVYWSRSTHIEDGVYHGTAGKECPNIRVFRRNLLPDAPYVIEAAGFV